MIVAWLVSENFTCRLAVVRNSSTARPRPSSTLIARCGLTTVPPLAIAE